MKLKIEISPLWWLLLNQLWQSINTICTYLWLVHKNGLDAVANHWTWSQSWSLLYRRPASCLILIQVLKWSPYALDSWFISWVTWLKSLQLKTFFTLLTSSWHQTTNPESTNICRFRRIQDWLLICDQPVIFCFSKKVTTSEQSWVAWRL